jgi:hypothetical protein
MKNFLTDELAYCGLEDEAISRLVADADHCARLVTQNTGLSPSRVRADFGGVDLFFSGADGYGLGVQISSTQVTFYLDSDHNRVSTELVAVEDLHSQPWDRINDYLGGFDADLEL